MYFRELFYRGSEVLKGWHKGFIHFCSSEKKSCFLQRVRTLLVYALFWDIWIRDPPVSVNSVCDLSCSEDGDGSAPSCSEGCVSLTISWCCPAASSPFRPVEQPAIRRAFLGRVHGTVCMCSAQTLLSSPPCVGSSPWFLKGRRATYNGLCTH